MDDLRPYGATASKPSPPPSEAESVHGQKRPAGKPTNNVSVVTWEAQ